MNSLVIPPSPNWYQTGILSCAPDNTLIYGARNDVIIIENSKGDEAADVKIISRAHSQKIVSTGINRNWGQPNKLLVTVGEDKIVKLWNVATREKKLSHNAHIKATQDNVIGVTFAGDERVISVSENGVVIVWNTSLNQTNCLKDLFGFKVTITSISTCPHVSWLTAFGLKNGLVIIADLRKQGKIIHKLRGHDKSVLSLAWCPVGVNIFPKYPNNYVGIKKIETHSKHQTEPSSHQTDVSNEKSSDLQEKHRKKNIWGNLKHADDDEPSGKQTQQEDVHPLLKVYDTNDIDFLKECEVLKKRILQIDVSDNENNDIVALDKKEERPVLKPKRRDNKKEGKPIENLKEITEIKHSKDEDKTETEQSTVEENFQIGGESSGQTPSDCNKEETSSIKNEEDENNTSIALTETNLPQNDGEDVKEGQNEEKSESGDGEIKREIPISREEEEPRKEFLLASSGREGNIYIWRAGTDGRMQTFLTVPNRPNYRKSKTSSDKVWITLCWVSPTKLLSSSKSNELLQWTLPKPRDVGNQMRIVHNDHSSTLFSIAAPIVLLNEYNWLEDQELNAWTMGQDRLLLNTSLKADGKNLNCYPTMTRVECLHQSTLDPNRLAIGTGEGHIKVWDLSRPHVKNIVMTDFYQKIQSKVEALAWHPIDEMILAYGTLEGRVGYLDTGNRSKMPTVLPNFFKSQIHKVEWGPLNGNKDDMGLFVVAEGKLVVFDVKKKEKDPTEVDLPENTRAYTFSWKPDYSMLLVGTKSGSVISYSTDYRIMSTHYFQHKFQNIYWHPDASESNVAVSAYCNCFAAVSNSKQLVVYRFNSQSDIDKQIIAKYDHGDFIASVAWSPFEANKLVIAGDDGIIQVFDIESCTVCSTYINTQLEGLLTVAWSPIDTDFIISAGRDQTLKVWRISDHPPKDEKEIMDIKKTVTKETFDTSDLHSKVEKVADKPDIPKIKKPNKINLLPNFYTPKNTSQTVEDLKALLEWKENSSSASDTSNLEQDCNLFNIFGSNADMLKLIQVNEKVHKERGKYSLNNMLALFKGDINTAVKEAIDEKRVNTWIISLAPMVSPKLWQTACEVYAQQLSEESDSDPLEMATYYLACHQVEKAIDSLCESGLFREALALAKSRLAEGDPTIITVIEKWAKYSVYVGNFETAAQCNIYLGKYEDAASVLFRRSDLETLELAVDLAEKSGNEDLHKAVLFRYNAFKTESNKENDLQNKDEAVQVNGKDADVEKNSNKVDLDTEKGNGDSTSNTKDNIVDSDETEDKIEKAENTLDEELGILDKSSDAANERTESIKISIPLSDEICEVIKDSARQNCGIVESTDECADVNIEASRTEDTTQSSEKEELNKIDGSL